MMMRAREPASPPYLGLAAAAIALAALAALAVHLAMPAGEASPISDLLRRAQSEAHSHHFTVLVSALDAKYAQGAPKTVDVADVKPDASVDATNAKVAVVKPAPAPKVHTATVEKPAQVVAEVSPSIANMPANRLPKMQPAKASARQIASSTQKPQVVAETAKSVWLRRGRSWAGMIASQF